MIQRQTLKWYFGIIAWGLVLALPLGLATAQDNYNYSNNSGQSQGYSAAIDIDNSVGEIKLILGTSRVLNFDYVVHEIIVENQDILQATPISSTQILVSGKKLGFSSITLSDGDGKPRTVNIHVMGDVRKLEATLHSLFPESNVHATALNTSVVLQGTVASANHVPTIIETARDFFPTVHNNMRVGDSQLVAIEVKVYEVSRTKLRQAGFDWNFVTTDFNISSTAANVANPNLTFNIINDNSSLAGFLDLLERNTLAKLLDAPLLVTMNGRPAEFLEGGEIPFEVNQGLGNVAIEFRPFGTKLDVVPIVLGQNRCRLEIRAEVSEPAADLTSANGTPGFRVRRVNTGVEMKMGHTLVLAGDYREEVEAETSGVPGLKNMPWIGGAFRRVRETKNELELVILMTPRYITETDPGSLPPVGPGQLTASPSDCELYINGTIEVPRCEQDCPGAHGLAPTQPNTFTDGTNDWTDNEYLNQRPEQTPDVIREYQRNFPGTPVGQKQNSRFGYPNQQQQNVQNPNWRANEPNTIPASNSTTWPTKKSGAQNTRRQRPSYPTVSSRRNTTNR